MKPSLVLQAIVFDYDGVLADTEPLHLAAFQETLAHEGVELSRADYYERYLGLDDEGVFRGVFERRGDAVGPGAVAGLVADKAHRFRRRLADVGTDVLFPTVPARLAEWSARVSIAIASGSPREEIEPVLAAAGLLEVVPVIVAWGETAHPKPHPQPYLRAIELLNEFGAEARTSTRSRRALSRAPRLDPGRCVAVEDSPVGIAAARAAGVKVVALATGHPFERLARADLVLPRFEDLALARLASLVCGPPADLEQERCRP